MQHAASGLLGLVLLTVGCATRGPQTYRLIARDKSSLLIPPGVPGPDVSRRVFTAEVAPGSGTCATDSDAVEVRRKGHRLRLTLNRDTLVRQPAGWLSAWTAAAEARNCVRPGEGLSLASRILESLPMDPIFSYSLLHPSYRQSGYVDLGPEIRLEVNSPITRDGAPPIESSRIEGLTVEVKTSAGLLGFEKAWYAVRPKPGGAAGSEIVPLSAERHIGGNTEAVAEPARNYFLFPPDTGFYRLFYKTDEGMTRIVVAGARTRSDLQRATQAAVSATDTCKSFEEGRCVVLPQHVGANPDVVAIVNGQEIPLPVGSSVGTAIQAGGEKDPHSILPQLRVRRLYNGKPVAVAFDRSSQEILAMPLFGGEEISWR